ncbi:hypothetical protein CASFOL_031872 [Castilleja foliolosa]|uniref:Uncharacterized protein n=1 Tax=Castilleja foliolosa TaxID=1961234 RepID=A0ABD3C113_9LAMI
MITFQIHYFFSIVFTKPTQKFSPSKKGFVSEKKNEFTHVRRRRDIEHDRVMGNDDGGDIYGGGDGDRHNNYTKSNIDGNADADSNDVDMYSDSDLNTDSDGDPEGDGNVERGGVEGVPMPATA